MVVNLQSGVLTPPGCVGLLLAIPVTGVPALRWWAPSLLL
jgi:hypothetical protein